MQGDTISRLNLDGSCQTHNCDQDVDIVISSSAIDYRDGAWHQVKLHMKYNSVTAGANNRDGEFDIWVDGVHRYSARSVINIHPDSPHYWEQVFLGDYTNTLPSIDTNLFYDNVIISDGPLDAESQLSIRADVDRNAVINTTDARLTLRNALGLDMLSTNWQASATTGDADCDSHANSKDALLILRNSLGLDMSGTGWCVN